MGQKIDTMLSQQTNNILYLFQDKATTFFDLELVSHNWLF